MRGLRVAHLLVCSLLLVSMGVWAEAAKTADSATEAKQTDPEKTVSQTSSTKKNSSTASRFKATRSLKHGERKHTADDNQQTADTARQQVTELNLQLPQTIDEQTGAASLDHLSQDLPDLFAPRTEEGRVSFDGSLLVEEDLEINPGAGLDTDDSNTRNNKEEDTTVLDEIEGAQLNIRLKID